MNTILLVLLIIITLNFIFELILDLLNLKYRKQPVPDVLSDVYPPDRYNLQQRYEVETTRFSFLQGSVSFIGTLLVFYLGWLGLLHEWVISFELGNVLTTLVFFAVIVLVTQILSIPFSLWSTFVIEEKYGFNRITPKLFVIDTIKSLLLLAIIGGGLLALITWIFYATEEWFWIIALGVMVVFSFIANALYSRVIVPLFNKQEPLPEGELLTSIKEFGQKVNFPVKKVFVMDGSKRSTKGNAYFSGFGRNRRVVLFDTLLEKMNNEEVLAVLAHEIGHFRKRHIWINMGLGVFQSAIILYIFGQLAVSTELAVSLGYTEATEPVFHLSLIAFGVLFSPIEHILGLFTNALSRKMEYQADNFAKKHGFGDDLISGLKKLSAENLSNLTPHPAYVFVNYSHPTLLQRVRNIIS